MSQECKEIPFCWGGLGGFRKGGASCLRRSGRWARIEQVLLAAVLLLWTVGAACGGEVEAYLPTRQLLQAGTVFSGGRLHPFTQQALGTLLQDSLNHHRSLL